MMRLLSPRRFPPPPKSPILLRTHSAAAHLLSRRNSNPTPPPGAGYKHQNQPIKRYSTLSVAHDSLLPRVEILNFLKSSFGEIEGSNHRWLNSTRKSFNKDDCFLVLVNAYIKDSKLLDQRELIGILERVKWVQQRYPKLHVFGLQCGKSVSSVAARTQIIQTVMEEFVTFPILISDHDFLKMMNGVCYLFFDGCSNHLIHHKLDIDHGVIIKAIEEFNRLREGNSGTLQNSNRGRTTERQVVEEPSIYSSLRNLLLCYPGSVSVDENGKRLFISDSNHHRIIITDVDGKILDCIGSTPGFEDGEFESAKLLRPAASFYDVTANFLYFVDSENHAIRRADMERRVLETVYPVSIQKSSDIWSLFLDKLGLERKVDEKPEGPELDSLSFPWHLLKLGETDLLIINRSFETSWIIDMTTGEIKEVLRGGAVLDAYEHMIMDKVSLLKDIHGDWSRQMLDHSFPLGRIMYVNSISSVAKLGNKTVFCDSATQRILKFDTNSRSKSYIQFSNLKVLGLPYWFICPLERVFNRGYLDKPRHELLHHSDVQPGRCQIHVTVHIPKGVELAAPLEEACIWRQARGTAAEVYGLEKKVKAGVAQKFYDQLDNLVLENSEIESDLQDEEISLDRSIWDKDKVHFNCTVDLSPGTCELVVSAVLYLQLKKSKDTRDDPDLEARRILGLEKLDVREQEKDSCIDLLLKSCGDPWDIVFMKPLHLRMRLDCADHPPAMTSKETIIDDTVKEINVSLE